MNFYRLRPKRRRINILYTFIGVFLVICYVLSVAIRIGGIKGLSSAISFKEEPLPVSSPKQSPDPPLITKTEISYQPDDHPVNYVLIVGYFRGGTTMMLDVLAQSDDSFYVFEPINFLSFDTYEKAPITFLNGSSRLLDEKADLPKAQAEMLTNWFQCRFAEINISDLKSSNLQHHSKVTKSYYRCQLQKNITDCLKLLEESCRPRQNRILKVVRMRMSTLGILLEKMPFLKVIYLLRDPRGMLHSLIHSKLVQETDLKRKAEVLCKIHMRNDIQSAHKLLTRYPQNILMIRYETLVSDIMANFQRIFDHTNLIMSSRVKEFMKLSLLGKSGVRQNPFLTKHGDAKLIANN